MPDGDSGIDALCHGNRLTVNVVSWLHKATHDSVLS